MKDDGKDVHTEHCCVYPPHGCKYRDKNCPVVLRTKEQSYPCEECDNDSRSGVEVIDLVSHLEMDPNSIISVTLLSAMTESAGEKYDYDVLSPPEWKDNMDYTLIV